MTWDVPKEYMGVESEKERIDKKLKNTESRLEYWNQPIAFDCPLKGIRHSIDWCFNNCEMWGREYRDTGDGRTAAFLFCHASIGEKMLHDGSITRDN